METLPLINIIEGNDRDWKIYREKISKIYDPSFPKFQSPKLDIYIKLLKKGRIFPPIVLDEKNWVVDGTHRMHAYIKLDRKTLPVIKPVGPGTGKIVSDSVYKNIEFYHPGETPDCFICGEQLFEIPENINITMSLEFPDGLPRGPIYVCRKDRIIINKRKFLLWRQFASKT